MCCHAESLFLVQSSFEVYFSSINLNDSSKIILIIMLHLTTHMLLMDLSFTITWIQCYIVYLHKIMYHLR